MGNPSARLIAALLAGLMGVAPVAGSQRPPPERKRLLARRAPHPPALDGVPGETLWKQAPAGQDFVDVASGRPAPGPAEVRVRWDARNVYLSIETPAAPVTVLVHGGTMESGSVALDLTARGALSASYQPDGAAKARSFRSRARAAVRPQAGRWTAEIALPMAELRRLASARARVPPAPGDVWGLNVVWRDSAGKAAAWSRPSTGDLHRLDQFGELVFVEPDGEDPLSDEGREAAERRLGKEADDEPAPRRR